MKLLPNLTGLRFFLAFTIVLYHVPQFCRTIGIPFDDSSAIFHKGPQAVYVFFTISGFLIIRQLYQEKSVTGTISLARFFKRRMLRIFPVYFLVLAFGFLYYRSFLPALGYAVENHYDLGKAVLLSVFFFPNIVNALYRPGGILEILWSIGIEEQFYLAIAPLLLLLPQRRILGFLGLFTVLYFALFFSGWLDWLQDFQMYFFYFSAGGLVSILQREHSFLEGAKWVRPIVFVAMGLYFFTSFLPDNFPDSICHLVGLVLFPLLVVVLCQSPLGLLNNKVVTYLGKISYGIYMYHAIALQGVGFVFLKCGGSSNLPPTVVSVAFVVCVMGFTLLAAHLSYQYYEKRFLRRKAGSESSPAIF